MENTKKRGLRLHWGTGLAIAMGAFILMMMVFLALSIVKDKEVPVRHAYEKGLKHEEILEAKRNTMALAQPPTLAVTDRGVRVIIPTTETGDAKVQFVRPNSNALDFQVELKVQDTLIPLSMFRRGLWQARLSWTSGTKPYIFDQTLTLP